MPAIRLEELAGDYAVARLAAGSSIPPWADGPGFVSISRTQDELSIVCLSSRVPVGAQHESGWSCFKFVGPFAFNETGIAMSVIRPLSENGIAVFLVSTFDTDYLLIKMESRENAMAHLTEAGHVFV